MAALASSAVTVDWHTRFSATVGSGLVLKQLEVVLTGQGDGTDTIGAEALGMERILMVSPAVEDDGSEGHFLGVNVGTDNGNANGITTEDVILLFSDSADTPTTVSGTFHFTVIGTI